MAASTLRAALVVALLALAAAGCDNPATPLDATMPDAYTAPTPDGGAIDAGAPVDAATPMDAPTMIDAGPMCPDLADTWDASLSGDGCGGPTTPGEVTIDQDSTTCVATFTSLVPKGDPPVNGTATIGADGSFTASLTIGTTSRSCVGTFDDTADPNTITLVCDTDACTLTLARSDPP